MPKSKQTGIPVDPNKRSHVDATGARIAQSGKPDALQPSSGKFHPREAATHVTHSQWKPKISELTGLQRQRLQLYDDLCKDRTLFKRLNDAFVEAGLTALSMAGMKALLVLKSGSRRESALLSHPGHYKRVINLALKGDDPYAETLRNVHTLDPIKEEHWTSAIVKPNAGKLDWLSSTTKPNMGKRTRTNDSDSDIDNDSEGFSSDGPD